LKIFLKTKIKTTPKRERENKITSKKAVWLYKKQAYCLLFFYINKAKIYKYRNYLTKIERERRMFLWQKG